MTSRLQDQRFSPPDIHQLSYADDFWPAAAGLRHELLNAPCWIPMTQQDQTGQSLVETEEQNGLSLIDFTRMPGARAFRDYLHENRQALCALVGIDTATADSAEIEMNGMAYGGGCWLAPHTDFLPTNAGRRLAAWMLYLTHPDDREWTAEDGGAVRLRERARDMRLSPKFNRFALFQVSASSVHEIERVRRAGGWEHCRLALSGWFHGPNPVRHEARLFVRRTRPRAQRATPAAQPGLSALTQLLQAQRQYAGLDSSSAAAELERFREQLAGQHIDAPPGTVFSGYVPGPAWCIFVTDENGTLLYFGPRNDYKAE